MRFIIILIFISKITTVFAQDTFIEDLLKQTDEGLLDLFYEVNDDTLKQEKISREYLKRGRKRKDTIMMARGYDRLARIFHPKKNIAFADSIIALTKDIDNITYPGLAYLIKAREYSYLENLTKAVENTYTSYNYALKNDNVSQKIFALQYLIEWKTFWGNRKDALELQQYRHSLVIDDNFEAKLKKTTRVDFYKNIPELIQEEKIKSLFSYILCYFNLNDVENTRIYFEKFYKENKFRTYCGYSALF